MGKQLDIRQAVKALVAAAVPTARIAGFDQDASRPSRVEAGGVVLGEMGDAGEPESDLSPIVYYFDQPFMVSMLAPDGLSDAEASSWLSDSAGAIGAAVIADRQLGGLAEWVETTPVVEESTTAPNSATQRWGVFELRVAYATADPLN